VAEVMVAFDVLVPSARVGFGVDEVQHQGAKLVGRLIDGEAGIAVRGDAYPRVGTWTARWRELDQPIGLHAEHGDTSGHLLEPSVRLAPIEDLAE